MRGCQFKGKQTILNVSSEETSLRLAEKVFENHQKMSHSFAENSTKVLARFACNAMLKNETF